MKLKVLKDTTRRPGVFCYCMVRDEEWFLPHFLRHYRALGVSYFIFYDDGSTDGTLDILCAQEDCLVLTGPFSGESLGGKWCKFQTLLSNTIPEHFGGGQWSFTADADEFLVLPTRFSRIDEVAAQLERSGQCCALAAMIDFYPARLSERNYEGLSPFEGSPWFDRDLGFRRKPGQVNPSQSPGGIRVRLLRMLAQRHPDRFQELFGSLAYRYARLSKVPLVKTGTGVQRSNPHFVNVEAPMDLQLGLAHFKFHPRADQRIELALRNKTHVIGAIEYRFLKAIHELFPDEDLVGDRSVRFGSPRDMEEAGMIWAK